MSTESCRNKLFVIVCNNQNISETESVQFNLGKQTSSPKSPAVFLPPTYVPGLTEKLKRILNNFNIKFGMKLANALRHYFKTKDSTSLKLKKVWFMRQIVKMANDRTLARQNAPLTPKIEITCVT